MAIKIFFVYLFLTMLGLCCCTWAFSSFREQGLLSSGGMWAAHCSLFSCYRSGVWSVQLCSCGQRLSCPTVCEILPDQGPNWCSLHWQTDSQALDHQGSPRRGLLKPQLICELRGNSQKFWDAVLQDAGYSMKNNQHTAVCSQCCNIPVYCSDASSS